MPKKRKKDNRSQKEKDARLFLIVVVVVIIIVTLGFFFWWRQKQEEKKIERENKLKRLKEIEGRIQELEKHKAEIEAVEKKILIKARLIIGILLVVANIFYKIYFVDPFNLKDMLTFNSAILLCYSFFAFITYGTPSNLASNLKQRIAAYLRSEHIDSLEELNQLLIERTKLVEEIKALEVLHESV